MFDPDYSFLDRLLHRVALDCALIAEVSFELDQAVIKTATTQIIHQRHVFVSGLARAGTTILMRKFHGTGYFRSLTYRDMPFVLAPNLWRRLSQVSRRTIISRNRAHADGLLIDSDSPESFDEVFWRIFAGHEYIASDRLKPHIPDKSLMKKYVGYINAILSASEPGSYRYLSKNNNNILRLGALHHTFPNALILIPFREPLQHAYSLLQQHTRFLEMQRQRQFVLAYMTWVGHYEFGAGHKPIMPDGAACPPHPTSTLNYWLHLWCEVYSWLQRSAPKAALFICYEHLCARPGTWGRLTELADIPDDSCTPLKLKQSSIPVDYDDRLADRAGAIYATLLAQAREEFTE